MKNQEGISLISLVITIAVLTILSFSISINANSYIERKKQSNFESDINSLIEEVKHYYAEYKELPKINKYSSISMLNAIKNINDNDNYYVIDLSLLGVNLNYGKDYDTISKRDITEEITDLLDIYIINEQSQTIYYPKGLEYNGKINYTDNTKYTNINYTNVSEVITYKRSQEYLDKNTKIKDINQNTIVIPKGFKIAEDSGLTVDEGIVVEDNDRTIDGTGKLRGNQFVWVPVGKITKADGNTEDIQLKRYVFKSDGTVDVANSKLDPNDEILLDTYSFIEGTINSVTKNTHAIDIEGFIKSVNENGGYYIARYEASYGLDGKPNSKISTSSGTISPTKEGQLWNSITQINAGTASKNMYNDSHYTVDLVNSYAWDTAIQYIQLCSGDIDYSRQNSLNVELGNTGRTDGIKDERCKINDMASNTREWTTETSNSLTGPCTYRGGDYKSNTLISSDRNINSTTSIGDFISFRTIIYI